MSTSQRSKAPSPREFSALTSTSTPFKASTKVSGSAQSISRTTVEGEGVAARISRRAGAEGEVERRRRDNRGEASKDGKIEDPTRPVRPVREIGLAATTARTRDDALRKWGSLRAYQRRRRLRWTWLRVRRIQASVVCAVL